MDKIQFKQTLSSAMVVAARSQVPVDTGNMRDNAVYVIDRGARGFSIVWNPSFAYYMEYVDKGTDPLTPKKRANINFVKRGVALALKQIYAEVNGPTNLQYEGKPILVARYNKWVDNRRKGKIDTDFLSPEDERQAKRFIESLGVAKEQGFKVHGRIGMPYIIYKKREKV